MRRQGSLIAMTPLPSPLPKAREGGQAPTPAPEEAGVVYCPVGIKAPATGGEDRYDAAQKRIGDGCQAFQQSISLPLPVMCRRAAGRASSSAAPPAAKESSAAKAAKTSAERPSDGFFGFSSGLVMGAAAGALMMYLSCIQRPQ